MHQADGAGLVVRPTRVRCRGCQVTHVLLPAVCAPRSGYATDVIGPALIAGAMGAGHRVITAELQLIR
ncbi:MULTISPECIES: hypothetical protein [Streptomyces]|uniref:hypothetical protein n=1 Tax=Streptomyces TaxID=1883 RepID=UPI002E301C17|nr:hypothetical protein [Streptomyces canus]